MAASSIAVDATSIYWTAAAGSAVYKAPIGGGTVTEISDVGYFSSNEVAVFGGYVYWTSNDEGTVTFRTPVDATPATAPQTVANNESSLSSLTTALAVDSSGVYMTWNEGTIVVVPLSGIGASPNPAAITLVTGLVNPTGIAVDANNVYWTESGNAANAGTVKQLAKY